MNEFEYAGRHYRPVSVRLPKDPVSRMWRMASVGIGNYPWSSTKYDYEEFYKAAASVGGGDADTFLCVEDGLVYIPHENELMLYKNKNGSAYQYSDK